MTFGEYQEKSQKTAVYSKDDRNFNYPLTYPALGLASEAGEVAGKIKKAYRDSGGIIDPARREEIGQELGDVLWYASQLATELGLSLDEIAADNIAKLHSRLKRGKLGGDGDDR